MADFLNLCSGCGACQDNCPFLAAYGTPDRILSEHPDAAFRCTSCRRCDTACPLDLSPSAAFFEAKERLVRQNQLPPPVRKALDGARGFAKAGHGFPFSFYGKTETVFWPGCGLAANRPGLVRQIRNILRRRLGKRVGLILDCCYDPVYEFGDTETALTVMKAIHKRLRDGGVKTVITGCLNCHKILSQHLEDLEVVFVLELLPPELFSSFKGNDLKSIPLKDAYLHHPCPSLRWEHIRNHAKQMADQMQTSPQEASAPHCCGSGGGVSALAPELADRFLNRIGQEANGRTMITYCVGCQNRFLKNGAAAVHLLECLPGMKPRHKVPSALRQWAGRFALALLERLKTGRLMAACAVFLLIIGGVYLNQQHAFSADLLTALLARYPVLAPLIFLGVYALAPSLFLPSIPLTLAAGFFWGPVWGVVFSIFGATIGSCLPFFLARYLFQDAFKSKISAERWQWLQEKVRQHGWKAVAFTRLIPVFPFNLLNYLFGLTPIPFCQYLWSTFAFMLPPCIAFVAFGSSLGELIVRGNVRGVVIGVIIALIAFLCPVALRPLFRKVGRDDSGLMDNQPEKGKDT